MKKFCKSCGAMTPNRDGYCDECRREYRAKHPYVEKRPDANGRGYTSRWTKFARSYLLQHPVCAICGKPAKVVDHKVFTAQQMKDAYGGFDYNPDLYQALCYGCNARKARADKVQNERYFAEKNTLGGGDFFSEATMCQRASAFPHTLKKVSRTEDRDE